MSQNHAVKPPDGQRCQKPNESQRQQRSRRSAVHGVFLLAKRAKHAAADMVQRQKHGQRGAKPEKRTQISLTVYGAGQEGSAKPDDSGAERAYACAGAGALPKQPPQGSRMFFSLCQFGNGHHRQRAGKNAWQKQQRHPLNEVSRVAVAMRGAKAGMKPPTPKDKLKRENRRRKP